MVDGNRGPILSLKVQYSTTGPGKHVFLVFHWGITGTRIKGLLWHFIYNLKICYLLVWHAIFPSAQIELCHNSDLAQLGVWLLYQLPCCMATSLPEFLISFLIGRGFPPTYVLGGDFHLPSLETGSKKAQDFIATMTAIGVSQVKSQTWDCGHTPDLEFLLGAVAICSSTEGAFGVPFVIVSSCLDYHGILWYQYALQGGWIYYIDPPLMADGPSGISMGAEGCSYWSPALSFQTLFTTRNKGATEVLD